MYVSASISIKDLSKSYDGGKTFALDKLTLHVNPGEVYGFLGANGAGKSTTIRLLLNFIQPTSGDGWIVDKHIVKDSVGVKRHIGYLSGEVALWPKVTAHELFTYLSKLQGHTDAAYLEDLIKRFEAEPEKRIDELSKGNKQKIGIIQALMHQPEVLILDEPTSGLDPLMQDVFYQTIREASARGAAVFVSSHNLAEAQRMCDRVGIIKHGRLIHEQTVKGDTNLGGTTFRVVLKHPGDAEKLGHDSTLKIISAENVTVLLQPKGSIAPALASLSHYDIVSLTTEQLNLEDEFLEYYGDGA